jgi:hypothetical protein
MQLCRIFTGVGWDVKERKCVSAARPVQIEGLSVNMVHGPVVLEEGQKTASSGNGVVFRDSVRILQVFFPSDVNKG